MEASEESLLFADVPRQTASRFIIYDYSPRYYKLRPYRGVLQESHLPTSISDEDEDNSEYEDNSEDGLIDNIHYAIECDNLDAVQKHLDDPAALESVISYRLRPSEVPQKDVTPLMLAAELGGRANVELLLNRGANVFATTNTNTTALHLAAEEGYENIVEILLGRGGTKLLEMATIHGRTPLLAAAYKGHASVVKLLLDKGADIDAMERVPDYFPGGWKLELSAFSLAAQQGHVSVLDILLSRIPETKFEDDYGSQALHYAAGYGHLVVVKRLLKDHFRLLNSQGIRGETAVSLAMRNGNLDVFLYLLDKGADISGKGDTGGTFLYQTVRHAHLQAVNLILTKEPNLLDVQIKIGQTAIFAALENDQLEIFDYLFDKGADITIKDWSGNTPLHYAAQHGHLQAVDRILEKEDGLLDLQNHDGKTAISLALSGNTSLHYAAKAGHLQALGRILAREPSLLNSKGEAGQTGLLCALRHCRMDVARYLIEEGVDITLAPDDGQTALEVACAWAFYEITSSFQGRTIIVKGSIYSWTERLDDGDSLYDAVLATTAIEACVPIVFQLLEAEIYFPRFPARAEPHFSGIHEFMSVERFLLQIYDGEIDDIDMKSNVSINKHGDAILYWAILNGQEELVSKCMSEIQILQAP
ncbi:Mg2+ transporter protein CorA-like/Zinc transport protein ZntB [Penicillium mononematosum]|uniref:Mg2+ transporter protein CorA-like/Zinc transport protein ZntB n=1 Tax=Penicillium mononematosum TaxID=268346 RepID=UPI002547F35A|nr:Mg2+ transporter protein CorA-like/Zinc transport protein ZntB [Penicillium mononematosum]KAJ6177984.1 Mg2+ transporter protein CorA-like/Zinc transport protein ZntB [Penicillium mononematosum]